MSRLLCLVLVFLLPVGSVNFLSAAPPLEPENVHHGIEHLPEVEAPHNGDPWHIQLMWLGIGSLIALVVFCIGADIYHLLKKLVKFLFTRPIKKSVWKAAGQWVDPSQNVSLFSYRKSCKGWPLTVKEEGFRLLVGELDSDKGTASGTVLCPNAGHMVGAWVMEPNTQNPNRFSLRLKLTDRDEFCFLLKRAG